MGCGDVRLLRTIGGVDFTRQERATLNKLTMPTDDIISVPMRPGVDSLNVAVTVALVVYEAFRQRSALTGAMADHRHATR